MKHIRHKAGKLPLSRRSLFTKSIIRKLSDDVYIILKKKQNSRI